MSEFGLIRLPASRLDPGTVTWSGDTIGGNGNSAEFVGGLVDRPGAGRVVRTPGTTDPMCWTRGTLFNLGYATQLADAGAVNQDIGEGRYWDAPGAWGKAGAVVRHPRTLLIYSNFVLDDLFDRVDAAFSASLSALDVSVFATRAGRLLTSAVLTRGIPLASVDYTHYDLKVGYGPHSGSGRQAMDISASIGSDKFRAGKVFVASLLIAGEGLRGYYRTSTWDDPDNPGAPLPPDISGMTQFANHYSAPGPGAGRSNYVSYVLDDKIQQDLLTLATAAGRFEAVANVAYTPGLAIPDGTGAELVPAGAFTAALAGPHFRAAAYDPTDEDGLWSMVLADAIQFFSS